MSLRDPHFEDRLDSLLRRALSSMVSGQEPPDHVWRRVKAELEADGPSPRRFRILWLAPALQGTLILLLVMLGGVGLWWARSTTGSGQALRDTARIPSHDLPPPAAVIYRDEHPSPPGVSAPLDKAELRLLQARSMPRSVHRLDAEPQGRPIAMAALDVPPHPASAEGRLLEAGRARSPLPLEEQRFLTGGPHRW